MEGQDFETFKADIAENGLLEDIWLHPDGSIIDGRNRHRACIETETQPRFRIWDEQGDLVSFVVSLNLHRRHLNESQRAMIAARIANMPKHIHKTDGSIDLSQPDAAEVMSVSVPSIKRAKKVLELGTEGLQQAVDAGKVAVSAAAKVAEMPEEHQEFFVGLVNSGVSTSKAKRETVRHSRDEAPPLPDGKYCVLYADPPWEYDNSGFDQSAASQYPTMSVEEICNLPVEDLTQDDCVLFLWGTSPLLPEALQVMAAWGFKYKASRVWVKDRAPGMGWFVKTRHEFLLIGTKGQAHPRIRLDSIIEAPVTGHSEKPQAVYGDIETAYLGSKLELFARNEKGDWDMWGNEIKQQDSSLSQAV